MAGMTIGKLAAAEGVSVETVRFYQRRGLLPRPDRPGSGYREYTAADQERLMFIRRARRLGFTLTEIADLLTAPGPQPSEQIAAAATARLAAIDAQIRELVQQRCRLRQLADLCAHGDDRQCVALQLPAAAS